MFYGEPKQPSLSPWCRLLFMLFAWILFVNLSQNWTIFCGQNPFMGRRGKKGTKIIDLRPFLYQLKIRRQNEKGMLLMLLAAGSQGGARPQEVLALLPLSGVKTKIYRAALFIASGGELKTPAGIAAERYLEVFYGKEDCD